MLILCVVTQLNSTLNPACYNSNYPHSCQDLMIALQHSVSKHLASKLMVLCM